jgi:putative transcriptional regulator
MPVTVKLDDLLYAKRMTLTELAERVDITLANLSLLKTGKAKAIRFSTLESICKVLECQPGDLLGFEEGENYATRVQNFDPAPNSPDRGADRFNGSLFELSPKLKGTRRSYSVGWVSFIDRRIAVKTGPGREPQMNPGL